MAEKAIPVEGRNGRGVDMKLDHVTDKIITAAYNEARYRNHEYLTPEHILYSSLFFDEGREIVENCGGDVEALKLDLTGYFRDNIPVADEAEPVQTVGFNNVVQSAAVHVLSSERDVIKIGDIFIAIFEKPVASLLFVGPTGVGKTELSKQLSIILGIPLLRFDMSEYQEKHTVARLIGAPPGYVGYEEGGLLTDAVRKTPYCVLLLDEVEKAHPDIFNVLLQIMDYATLTDNTGRKADFRNAIIIMTSNAGAREIGRAMIGFDSRNVDRSVITKAVEKIFLPEFRNRLDEVVVFNHINEDMALMIAKKAIRQFESKLAAKNINLKFSDECYRWLAEKGLSSTYGAREILRVVQEKIKTYFVDEVLFGELSKGGTALVDIRNDGICIFY